MISNLIANISKFSIKPLYLAKTAIEPLNFYDNPTFIDLIYRNLFSTKPESLFDVPQDNSFDN